MYIWQLVADCLVIDPWTDDQIKAGKEAAAAQWDILGVDLTDQSW